MTTKQNNSPSSLYRLLFKGSRFLPDLQREHAKKILLKLADSKINPHRHGRNIDIRDSDIFIVSYPRSGNTWLRYLIANLVTKNEIVSTENINRLIPDIYRMRNTALSKMASPRILKSHEYFDPRYKRTIYIVRDPRSVCLSYYYYLRKLKDIPLDYTLLRFTRNFVKGKYGSEYRTWDKHLESWLANNRGGKNFLLVKYEDLKNDPLTVSKKILRFIGQRRGDAQIKKAINDSSFKNLKVMESKNSQNAPLVRSGKTDEWKVKLPKKAIKLIERSFGQDMKLLNYL